MKKNIGSVDKLIRLLLGLLVIGWGYFYQSWWGIVGVIPLATASLSFCPLYLLFGINTGTNTDKKN